MVVLSEEEAGGELGETLEGWIPSFFNHEFNQGSFCLFLEPGRTISFLRVETDVNLWEIACVEETELWDQAWEGSQIPDIWRFKFINFGHNWEIDGH